MEIPAGISTQSLTDPPSTPLRGRDQAEGYGRLLETVPTGRRRSA